MLMAQIRLSFYREPFCAPFTLNIQIETDRNLYSCQIDFGLTGKNKNNGWIDESKNQKYCINMRCQYLDNPNGGFN